METSFAVTVESLTRRFGTTEAVKGISFKVPRGSVFGFLGPNGAGKTTTIRMLTGLLAPSSGHITIAGLAMPAQRDEAKRLIGVVPDHQNLYDRLSARQHLQFFARLTDSPVSRVDEVLELLGLADQSEIPTQRLSRGWRQRVLIARGLLHEPEVFFLDEPTSALDPHSALTIRHVINTLREKGTTIFLTTHYMEEANSLCDRIAILHHGTIVAEDTPEAIRMRFGQPSMTVTVSNGDYQADTAISLPLNDSHAATELSSLFAEGRVKKIHSQEATLEEAFLRLTGSSWQEPESTP